MRKRSKNKLKIQATFCRFSLSFKEMGEKGGNFPLLIKDKQLTAGGLWLRLSSPAASTNLLRLALIPSFDVCLLQLANRMLVSAAKTWTRAGEWKRSIPLLENGRLWKTKWQLRHILGRHAAKCRDVAAPAAARGQIAASRFHLIGKNPAGPFLSPVNQAYGGREVGF